MKFYKYCFLLLVWVIALASGVQAGTPPQITIDTPTNGGTVAGLVAVSGTANDDIGLQSIEIRAGSGPWVTTDVATSWNFNWSTYAFAGSQSVTLDARVTDAEGQSTIESITLTVNNPKVSIKENGIIVVIGDSIAAGDNAPTNWPAELQTLLAGNSRSDVTVINEGEGGLSSKEFWLDAAHEGQKKSDVAAHPTINVAFLMLGHNDTRTDDANWHDNSETEYQSFMSSTIQWLQSRVNADGSTTQVIVVTPIPAEEPVINNSWQFPSDFNLLMQGAGGYTALLLSTVETLNVFGLDTLPDYDGGASSFGHARQADPSLMTSDTIHPDSAGHQQLAQLALSKLDLTLGGDPLPPVANAGPDQLLTETGGGIVSATLDGSASTDPDGTIVDYTWRENSTVIATGETPQVDLTLGTHIITLTVTDSDGLEDSDTVEITVVEQNQARITAGLVVYYPFDEGAGTTVADQSANGAAMDLAITGSVTWLSGTQGVNFAGGRIGTGAAADKLINAYYRP